MLSAEFNDYMGNGLSLSLVLLCVRTYNLFIINYFVHPPSTSGSQTTTTREADPASDPWNYSELLSSDIQASCLCSKGICGDVFSRQWVKGERQVRQMKTICVIVPRPPLDLSSFFKSVFILLVLLWFLRGIAVLSHCAMLNVCLPQTSWVFPLWAVASIKTELRCY